MTLENSIDEYENSEINDDTRIATHPNYAGTDNVTAPVTQPTDPGELQPITSEDQRRIQLKGNQPLQPPESGIPVGRFETKVRGEVVGSSEVDLTIPENREAMWKEYRQYFRAPKGPDRDAGLDQWYQKYWGKTLQQVEEEKEQAYAEYGNPLNRLNRTFQGLSIPGLGITDFAMDAIGSIPGLGFLDNSWDRATRLDDPFHQKLRKFASVVIPSMLSTKYLASKLPTMATGAAGWQRWLMGTGLWTAQETAIIGLSDVGEEENLLRTLADTFPGVFGERGSVPLPKWSTTNPGDSVKVREYKNMLDTAGLSIFGSILGIVLKMKAGIKSMSWFEPADDIADAYKARQVALNTDQAKLERISDINDVLGKETLDKITEKELINELEALKLSLDDVDDLDAALDIIDNQRQEAQSILGKMKSEIDPNNVDYDPDRFPLGPENTRAIQTPEPGNVAKNMGDTTVIKTSGKEGNPVNVLTPSTIRKGLLLGPGASRNAVMGVAQEAEELGRFKYLAEGFRFSQKQMNAAAWDIYESIIAAENMGQLRDIFMDNRDVKNLLLGKFKVAYINEEQARGAAFAMRDLVDRFLGRKVAESSARVMDTLGREAATMSRAFVELEQYVDNPRAMELIIDKIQFLMDEWALNKYIAGWTLRNKNWAAQILPENIDEAATALRQEFESVENVISARNKKLANTIRSLSETNPLAIRPLIDAYVETNGDVDSIAKLMKWADRQLTPLGMLKSPDPKEMNLFAKGAFSVVYNNFLSGISAFTATLGNTGQLMLRPITSVLGHGIWGLADDFEGFKRSMYVHGSMYETNKRALLFSWRQVKRGWEDPNALIENLTRKDFVIAKDSKKWGILEDLVPSWEQSGDYGRLYQYQAAKIIRDLGNWKYARYGITAMAGPDAFATSHVATALSRIFAYDEVFSEFGFADWKKIMIAEKKHYSNFFDKDGNATGQLLKVISGEIKLNLDDGVAKWLNQATTAYPITKHVFMFPRTQSNWVKNSLSWTPISAIPGMNKYSKVLYARTHADKVAALAEHGLDYNKIPHAEAIFKELRAEYTGRQAFSALMTKVLWDSAMAGRIRGNGHYNKGRRMKEWNELGYEPKTIQFPVPGKDNDVWVSYKGIPGVEQVLSILGDMSYYAADLDETLLENWQNKLMWTLSAAFFADSPFSSLEWLVSAANGDLSGWNRGVANALKAYVPAVGLAAVLRNSIDSAQKDIQGEIHEYIMNKVPPFNFLLPNQVDFWTGQPINDIDNPFLRLLNAVSPIKVSGTREPWRVWLEQIGYSGQGKLRTSPDGLYEYTTEDRQKILTYIGEQQIWKQIEKMRKSGKWDVDINLLRAHKATGDDEENEHLKLKKRLLPVYQKIDSIIRQAHLIADDKLQNEKQEISTIKMGTAEVDNQMKRGDVKGARTQQQKYNQLNKLLQMSK